MNPSAISTLQARTIERSNPIMFHHQGYFDEPNGRMITMIDEKDMDTLQPARTIAFDVFDFTVPFGSGSDPRPNENVSYVTPHEVKFHPTTAAPSVYLSAPPSRIQNYVAPPPSTPP